MDLRKTWTLNSLFFIMNLAIILGFVLKNEYAQIANPLVTSMFFLAIMILERFTSFKLKNYIRLLVVITLISHSLFGEYYRAYYTTGYFDNALHFFGSFAFGLLAFDLINSFIEIRSSKPEFLIFFIVFLSGTTLGVVFELIEFLLDVFLNERNQFGLIDTNLDLLYDTIGAFFAGIFMSLKPKFNQLYRNIKSKA